MNGSLDAGRETEAEVEVATGSGGLTATGLKYTFCKQSAINFPYSDRPCPWLLIKGDQATGHERPVGRPWGMIVREPSCHVSHLVAQQLRLRAVAQEPVA